MKKTNLIIFIVGLVLGILGMIGAFYYSVIDNQYESTQQPIEQTFDDTQIKNIDISLKRANLDIVSGDKLKLEGQSDSKAQNVKATTKGDRLALQLKGSKKSKTEININPFYLNRSTASYTLTVPQSQLNQLKINGKQATGEVRGISAEKVILDIEQAGFEVEESDIETFDGHVRWGSLDVSDTTLKQVKTSVNKGELSLEDVPADIPMTLNNQFGSTDVMFAAPLKKAYITTNNDSGEIDIEDLTNYKALQQNKSSNIEIHITNQYGTVTLMDK
ncbi:DUF4097 family beta strand repeat-containing protein [Staphylococcus sp. 17KM0847]|uniref:DUF4097 family beta strand repeat-containing protein n=1 Tax=Staphylococcus sp. 17KM0847 TaxID=2583989 RepID=UPI0015DC457D|nr:DUF4097 family beta strand repeat-containing protein [Staphylococcus sp. 17KM0847]QLK86704.1 DUF4097 domain-containing protein [Staphylococcus sp. 17KM0847]